MATYTVIKKGFYNGELYDPAGKRNILQVEIPFKPTPNWLKRIKEVKVNKEDKAVADKAAADKAEADKVEIDSVTFLEGPTRNIVTL